MLRRRAAIAELMPITAVAVSAFKATGSCCIHVARVRASGIAEPIVQLFVKDHSRVAAKPAIAAAATRAAPAKAALAAIRDGRPGPPATMRRLPEADATNSPRRQSRMAKSAM